MERHFILLHNSTRGDWWVCVEHINALHVRHSEEKIKEHGTWVYMIADNTPIRVDETIDEILKKIQSLNQ